MADNNDKKSDNERDHLSDHLIEWAPLINLHVNKLKDGLPPHVDSEDLYAAGMHGLIDAFHKYDPRKGAAFKTYASRRIEGKMRDHITGGTGGGVDNYHYKKAKAFMSQQPKEAAQSAPKVEEAGDLPPPLPDDIKKT